VTFSIQNLENNENPNSRGLHKNCMHASMLLSMLLKHKEKSSKDSKVYFVV